MKLKLNDLTDEQLILEFQENQTLEAYEILVRRFKDPLINFVYRFLGDKDACVDIVQDTMIKLYLHKDSYKSYAKFSTWIYTIAGNLAKNELKRRKRRTILSLHGGKENEDRPLEIKDDMFTAPDVATDSEIKNEIIQIKNAVETKSIIKCLYNKKYREIYPLKILNLEGFWYLIIYEPSDNKIKTFHLNTIKNIEVLYSNFRFDEEKIKILSESIKNYGVLQPIVLKPDDKGKYMIIAGERRYRASKLARKSDITAVIKDIPVKDIMEIALIENLQREELNPIEEALAYRSLIKNYEVTQEEISEAVGKSRPHITNTLRLLNLPQKIMDMIDQGQITAGHGKALLRVNEKNLQ